MRHPIIQRQSQKIIRTATQQGFDCDCALSAGGVVGDDDDAIHSRVEVALVAGVAAVSDCLSVHGRARVCLCLSQFYYCRMLLLFDALYVCSALSLSGQTQTRKTARQTKSINRQKFVSNFPRLHHLTNYSSFTQLHNLEIVLYLEVTKWRTWENAFCYLFNVLTKSSAEP